MLVSPCDAIVGACGTVRDGELLQVKGFPYTPAGAASATAASRRAYRNGCYATLRLTAGMYHRFHAPHDCRVEAVTYISGDTWNVNPIALRRIEKLFCKNERAVIRTRLARDGHPVTLVPVAAILVASIRLNFLEVRLPEQAGRLIACDADFRQRRGDGLVRARLDDHRLRAGRFFAVRNRPRGQPIRMGQPLMRRP